MTSAPEPVDRALAERIEEERQTGEADRECRRRPPPASAVRTRRDRTAPSRSGSFRRGARRRPRQRSAAPTRASRGPRRRGARRRRTPRRSASARSDPPPRSPRGSAKTRSTAPATRWRTDIARNGGRSRTTIASAMNVDPQTRYTVTRASQTRTPYRAAIRCRMAIGARSAQVRVLARLDQPC